MILTLMLKPLGITSTEKCCEKTPLCSLLSHLSYTHTYHTLILATQSTLIYIYIYLHVHLICFYNYFCLSNRRISLSLESILNILPLRTSLSSKSFYQMDLIQRSITWIQQLRQSPFYAKCFHCVPLSLSFLLLPPVLLHQ